MSDDDLGYKRPPEWTRFRKGKSGNPNGRPKKVPQQAKVDVEGSSGIDDIFRAEFTRTIKARDGGKTVELSTVEVATRALTQIAIKGNATALRDFLKLAKDVEERDAVRAQHKAADDLETYKTMVRWKALQTKRWNAPIEKGEEPVKCWPHPDDMLLDPVNMKWRIRGPFSEDSIDIYKFYQAQRDYYFTLATLKRRNGKERNVKFSRVFDVVWVFFDALLPLRWQMMGDQLENLLVIFAHLPIISLRKYLNRCEDRCDKFAPPPSSPAVETEIYKETNKLMRPLLKPYGYRSLAEFNHAFETHGTAMPWPKNRLASAR